MQHLYKSVFLIFHFYAKYNLSSLYFAFLDVSGYDFDYVFDWTILKYQQSQKNAVQPSLSVSIFFSFAMCMCACVFLGEGGATHGFES